jgi:hypothetical protein
MSEKEKLKGITGFDEQETTVLYFQNLTSLNDYAKQTEGSLADTVGGEWPEYYPPKLPKEAMTEEPRAWQPAFVGPPADHTHWEGETAIF